MPVSPSQAEPQGKKRRKTRQRKRKLYQKVREDLQLSDDLPTTSEGALKPETVPGSAQEEPRFPKLIGQSIRRGWAVPDERKPGLVDELISVVEDPDAKSFDKIAAFSTLSRADQLQYEKDQQYIRLDRVLEMWRGILGAIRNHVSDPLLVKAIVADVLRFLPPPAAGLELVEGVRETNNLETGILG